jgi:integrase
MLFGLVRPVKRSGSRIPQINKRIPRDLLERLRGLTLEVPIGDDFVPVRIGPTAESIRISLRTAEPSTVKIRHAAAAAHLEQVFQSLRNDAPVELTLRQVAALAGDVYREWAGSGAEEPSIQSTPTEDGFEAELAYLDPEIAAEAGKKAAEHLLELKESGRPEDEARLKRELSPLVRMVLQRRGIGPISDRSEELLMKAFLKALVDGLRAWGRHHEFDFTADPKAASYPEWEPPTAAKPMEAMLPKCSLTGLVADWWTEAKASGLKASTHESYSSTMDRFVAFLGHDEAGRVRPEDVIAFKDHRLKSINPATKAPISPKTVKDSDLAGLKSIFTWAVANRRMADNPAVGVTLKIGKRPKLREKGFTDKEAAILLQAATATPRGRESPKLHAAKRWMPWLLAYTGARVGEIAQLRKEDVRKEGEDWLVTITPEAGTVKTNEARVIPLHAHIVEMGFPAFLEAAQKGHLFLSAKDEADIRGPLRALKNRLTETARALVPDKNVAPNHGWRHGFKTIGMEVGIDHRILDAIQGHAPKTAGEAYGDVTVRAKAAAIAKLPRQGRAPSVSPPPA